MRALRIFKVVAYPLFGAFQFFVVPWWFALILCVALVGIAAMNLSRLLQERPRDRAPGTGGSER